MQPPLKKVDLAIFQSGKCLCEMTLSEFGTYQLGRAEACQISVPVNVLSRQHLLIALEASGVFVTDNNSANGTMLDKQPLQPGIPVQLSGASVLSLANGAVEVHLTPCNSARPSESFNQPVSSSAQTAPSPRILSLLNQQQEVLAGRSGHCDVVIDSIQASRKHALFSRNGERYFVEDLGTTNGTFVNGETIQGQVEIGLHDKVTIGTTTFSLGQGEVEEEYALEAANIEKVYAKGNIGLNKMTLKIPARQFIALMGPSGCGKSTLLKGLNGANPVTSGSIVIQGLKLNNSNYNTLKQYIGYVPQDDIVHGELSVEKTLYFAAKLRMSDDVSNEEINRKIDQVLNDLNLDAKAIRKNRINELSGGQRKRISIAVELLNDPKILFLDEPTSPLDPETIEDFLSCIRRLVAQGQTVIMVTHKPSDLDYVDQVIFLAKGGYHTFYGERERLLGHFKTNNIIEIYSIMKDSEEGKRWYDEWRHSSPEEPVSSPTTQKLRPKPNGSRLKQYLWLTTRYLAIKLSDHWNLALLMAQPIIISLLLVFIFNELQVSVMFMMSISAVWFGVSNATKEIVGELPVYERERMFNLSIGNYIASKVTVLSAIALIQVFIFVSVVYHYYAHQNGQVALWDYATNVGFMLVLSMSATLFGLLLSAVFNTTEKVMTFVPIALMPQIMLAGIIAPINSSIKAILSYFILGRWGTEGFAQLQDENARQAGKFADEAQQIPASVMQSVPAQTDQGMVISLQPQGAMTQLDLYNEHASSVALFPQSMVGVLIAISIISLMCLLGIYSALKAKDKRFV